MAIEAGDTVVIEYVGRFPDGSVFDTSRYEVAEEHGLVEAQDAAPDDYSSLSFNVGDEEVIEGLEQGVIGLEAGDTETLTIPPEVGLHVHAENGLHGDVTAVTDDAVEIDFNHELAGRTLEFEVEILDTW